MPANISARESCVCGSTLELTGPRFRLRPLLAKWQRNHRQCATRLAPAAEGPAPPTALPETTPSLIAELVDICRTPDGWVVPEVDDLVAHTSISRPHAEQLVLAVTVAIGWIDQAEQIAKLPFIETARPDEPKE